MSERKIPNGFKRFILDESFNDAIAPVFLNVEDKVPKLGMFIEKQHCNFVGFCHGGTMMTFMDIALHAAVSCTLGKYISIPTVNISFDFIAGAKEGDWISSDIVSVDLTRTMAFVNAMITGPKGNVARVSGCYKLPTDINASLGMAVDEYHQWRTQE